ncbi:hypothetical protein JKF63_03598 [Porcisia hertigi]|uniref:Uncharacterized protein n=1 Tax=Porcisia hertigi TaxID=2761500 RepID=A0A836HWM5_9TRYP|nr:hypothetical protein JKF63_03598 [Porcisia hertigi]
MGSDVAFHAFANKAIEGEIRSYFPDTALYRRLCWGGWGRAGDYLYREFEPVPVGPTDGDVFVTPTPPGGVPDVSPGPGLPRPKRRRTSIVEELQKGFEDFRVVASASKQATLTSIAAPCKQIESRNDAASTAVSATVRTGAAPYMVTCHRCTTRVTSAYPCRVLEGYVVLWAESMLEVECVATHAPSAGPLSTLPATEAQTHGDSRRSNLPRSMKRCRVDHCRDSGAANAPNKTSKPFISLPPPLLGLRPLLHRLTNTSADTRDHSAEDTTAALVPPTHTSKEATARSRKQQGCVHPNGTNPHACAEFTEPATQMVALQSLHIVRCDAARHVRQASFALQSVLQPGCQTALECYPRQMVHFGLLVYAAWHASSQTWQSILLGGDTCKDGSHTAGDRHAAALPAEGSQRVTIPRHTFCKRAASHRPEAVAEAAAAPFALSSASEPGGGTYLASLAGLLPNTEHDAVLILGLGGNVLGQCLDALLPPVVPLHIVEVEPSVLQACCEHKQFPEIVAVDNWECEFGKASSCEASKQASVLHRRKRRLSKSAGMAEVASPAAAAAAAVSLVNPSVLQRASDRIHRKSAAPVAFRATRQEAPGLLEGLTAQPRQVPSSTTKCVRRERSSRSASAPANKTPLLSQPARGEYVCFLQDAYAYLRAGASPLTTSVPLPDTASRPRRLNSPRGAAHAAASSSLPQTIRTKCAAPLSKGASARAATNGAAVEGAPPPIQYSMIFLDCYDPSKEHMLHEETLVELCARRLRPGGVLLVNAHVLPTIENLRSDFLHSRFATVQALRVSGCTQTVVVCVAHDAVRDGSPAVSETPASRTLWAQMLAEKRGRFTVRQIQLLASALNKALHRVGSGSSSVISDAADTAQDKASAGVPIGTALCSSSASRSSHFFHSATPAFRFDAAWLKSCRRIAVSPTTVSSNRRARPTSATPSEPCTTDFDLHVWQHYA